MAAADPPDDGHSTLFPKGLFEDDQPSQEHQAAQQESAARPFFEPPSHRAAKPPLPVAPSARIVNSQSPTTDEVDRLDTSNNHPPQAPQRPQRRPDTAPSDGPTVRNNPTAGTSTAPPQQQGSPPAPMNAPSPHLSAVPSAKSIATKCCGDGHPNNPDVRVCRICGVTFRPTTKIVQMTPGAIFRLIFEDGTAVEIADDIVVGRSPIDDNIVDTLTVDDPQVSRQHFVLEALGWQLAIRDCGSMNGTFLSRRGKRGRVRVSPDTAIPVQAGDTVHFGSRQALIVDTGPS